MLLLQRVQGVSSSLRSDRLSMNTDRLLKQKRSASGFCCVPGMAYILMVKVHRGDYHRSGQPLVEHQGCLSWEGIWRKVQTKLRPDEKKPQVRPVRVGWVCNTTQNPIDCGILLQVNAAGMRRRRYDLTPGDLMSGSFVIVTTNHEKSAEPIVVKKRM